MGVLRATIVQVGRDNSSGDVLSGLIVKLAHDTGIGDVVLLPENWVSGRPLDIKFFEKIVLDLYESLESNVFGGLQHVVDVDGHVRSVGLAAIEGSIYRVCEKIHPSKAVGERDRVSSGRLVEPLRVKGWFFGCIACVDIFYPEISRALVALGAQILYNPSSIPGNRVELWQSAVRLRGVENLVYSIGVNAVGNRYPDGRIAEGGSVVFSPWGKMLASLGPLPSAITMTLDLDRIVEAENRWAFREDFEIYYRKLYRGLH